MTGVFYRDDLIDEREGQAEGASGKCHHPLVFLVVFLSLALGKHVYALFAGLEELPVVLYEFFLVSFLLGHLRPLIDSLAEIGEIIKPAAETYFLGFLPLAGLVGSAALGGLGQRENETN